MRRRVRILHLVTLVACPLVLAGTLAFAAGQGPAASDKPAAGAKPATSDKPAAGAKPATSAKPAASEKPAAGAKPATSAKPAASEKPAASAKPAASEAPEAVEHPTEPKLTPEMVALRDGLRKALALVAKQPFNTRDNTPAELIQLCLAFGCESSIGYGSPSGKKVSAIGCLCWNYPCAGYRLLESSDGRVMARIGYGLEAHPSQFLAVLAQSAVPIDYEIRVGQFRGKVADLVEFEKLNCRSGADLPFTLIGLAHYLKDEQTWKNDLGEEWSIDGLIGEELARSTDASDREVTDRLMGLSYAINRQTKRDLPLDGQFLLAQQYIGKFQDYALGVQSSDGSWHPSFFARKGTSRDGTGVLRSTGHILGWLVFSLPEDRLEDPRVVRSVTHVTRLLTAQRSGWNVASMSARNMDAVMHAAQALSIYDRRVFKPQVPQEPAAAAGEALTYRNTPE